MHALMPLEPGLSDWQWMASLAVDRDILLPVSPGAIACLAVALSKERLEQNLAKQAWLCLGKGSFEALQNYFPAAKEDETTAAKPLRMMAKLEQSDMVQLLGMPSIRHWIGQRRVHLLCASHRVDPLDRIFRPQWKEQLFIHPVYRDEWERLTSRDWLFLIRSLARSGRLSWHIGSLALLERWQVAYTEARCLGCHQGIDAAPAEHDAHAAHAALVKATLLAPHPRIIERARTLGYQGEAFVVMGSDEVLKALGSS